MSPLDIGGRPDLQAVVVGAVIVDICEALIEAGVLVEPERTTCDRCGCLAHPHEVCPGCRAAARREGLRDV